MLFAFRAFHEVLGRILERFTGVQVALYRVLPLPRISCAGSAPCRQPLHPVPSPRLPPEATGHWPFEMSTHES